jgi:hypothetical protein
VVKFTKRADDSMSSVARTTETAQISEDAENDWKVRADSRIKLAELRTRARRLKVVNVDCSITIHEGAEMMANAADARPSIVQHERESCRLEYEPDRQEEKRAPSVEERE